MQKQQIPTTKTTTEARKNRLRLLGEFLDDEQEKYEAAGRVLTSEINQTSRALLNQLFLTGGSIVTLSSPLLINASSTTSAFHFTLELRLLLVIAVLFALASVIMGFNQFYTDKKFFQNSKDANSELVKKISSIRLIKIDAYVKLTQEAAVNLAEVSNIGNRLNLFV